MADVRPFRGIRPQDNLAAAVIAPPYDVLSEEEARAIVANKPNSFLRVTRSEVDLPSGSDAHSSEAYAMARENLDRFLAEGVMVQDSDPCFYLYVQTWKGRTQVGLMCECSTDEYDQGLIKKHELTRPDKEQDRVDHIATLNAQTGLVFLTFRDEVASLRDVMTIAQDIPPAWSVTTDDGVEHTLIVISDAGLVTSIQKAFEDVPALYIADGHHRSAAASRVAAERSGRGGFLAGVFPDSQLEILAYNRVVFDLNGHTDQELLSAISVHFEVSEDVDPEPVGRGHWTLYLSGRWYGLNARPGVVPDDPVGSLDVSVLQDRVLGPLLGIANPRTDKRIQFVGGIRGHQALSSAVDSGRGAVAFHLYPTGMDQLLAVADADQLMPPKSTWFEPKLRGGVLVNRMS